MVPNMPECIRLRCAYILPTIFDECFSYLEVVSKLQWYIGELGKDLKDTETELNALQEQVGNIQQWIDNFSVSWAEQLVQEYLKNNLASMIFVNITEAGYIQYNIPNAWSEITFNTTGLDINLQIQPEYGHLVLSY